MSQRACILTIEKPGLISLRQFNGNKFEIDLTLNSITSAAATDSFFLMLIRMADNAVWDRITAAGLYPKINLAK